MAKVVIFGNGQNAAVAHFLLTHDSEHEVIAFTVDQGFIDEKSYLGLPVIPYEDVLKTHPPDTCRLFLPISYRNCNAVRAEKYLDAKTKGYHFISYISSKAVYFGTPVGENCFILENNVIQPFTEIGDNCTLWSGNHIGHHSIIKDHCFIASHAVISGSVTVGSYSFVGVNATIRDNVVIGEKNVIGAGALILGDTEDMAVYSPGKSKKLPIPSNRLSSI